ncbi:FkbM family methyltransferase [Chitinophaga deserti]|uniref:FkbM family methyltransferase n=1 Tax=Chitinophaga deserti TaxID=2164099 RepID=UPI000D6DB2CB|nr:FkbM family methyltransferase [Chitinophaga deserti]
MANSSNNASSGSIMGQIVNGILKKFRTDNSGSEKLSFWTVKYLKHLPQGPLQHISWKSGRIWFTKSWELLHSFDEIITKEIYRFKAGSEAPLIIDCGANIGLSVLYFQRLYPQARIMAFEPDSHNIELLTKNVHDNQLTGTEIFREAVWTHTGSITFESTGGQGSRIQENAKGVITVPCRRLADLLQQPVDFLKIDIEGAEYPVILDCAPYLLNVRCLFLEYHGQIGKSHELTHMLEILKESGFEYYIKEAADNVAHPFVPGDCGREYEQQLNIFARKIN